jgi:NADPH:quinone reductase-like Zn-dependent oxidoreductase
LRLEKIDRPEVGADDVLVRIHAAGVHIGDWHVMTGLPYLLRVVGFGFRAPKWTGQSVGRGQGWIQSMLLSRFVKSLRPLTSEPNQADLRFLKELIETGKVTPVIDKTYPLSEVPEAIRYLKAGHARGKIVIAV